MKKSSQAFLSVILSVLLLCMSTTSVHAAHDGIAEPGLAIAADGASTYLTNCSNSTFVFSVVDDEAIFSVSYLGREATFVMAELTVQVQKKYLGFFWRDIGNEWVETSEDLHGVFSDSISADGRGTYRALFTLHIVGNTGIVDVIEHTIDCKY